MNASPISRYLRVAQAAAVAALVCAGLAHAQDRAASSAAKPAVDIANLLVGTAPLDRKTLIGNAPPPGEMLYSGQTSPGARLPHSQTLAAPMNVNVDLIYPTGVDISYVYNSPTMIGFTAGGSAYPADAAPLLMPVVGDWTVPPNYTQSHYDKASEKATPGYYKVDLVTFKTRVELTTTQSTSLMRFTFPATDRANVVLDLRREGGNVEVIGDRKIVGLATRKENSAAAEGPWFVAEFSRPFGSFGTFRAVHGKQPATLG